MEIKKLFFFINKNFTNVEKKIISDFLYSSFNTRSVFKKYFIYKNYLKKINVEENINKRIYALALNLANNSNFEESYFLLKRSLKVIPQASEEINLNIAKVLIAISKNKLAIFYLKRGEKINNKNFEILFNLGLSKQRIGNTKQALDYFNKVIDLNPLKVEAHRLYAMSCSYDKSNIKHLQTMSQIYTDKEHLLKNKQKSQLCFAIGKAYEDLRDFDKAFDFFVKANNYRRKEISYSSEIIKKQFESIKNISIKLKNLPLKHDYNTDKQIIFIVGMPRSGTTLLEQIISSHSKIISLGEPLHFPKSIKKFYPESATDLFEESFEDLKIKNVKNFIEHINDLYKFKIDTNIAVTDKLPFNFIFIGLINFFIPNAKIIHITRSPQDTCLSVYKNYFQGEHIGFAYDQKEIANYYNHYLNLMKFWRENQFNFYEIKYENLVTDLENEVKKIFNFINIDFEEKCLHFYKNTNSVSSLSTSQVRKKNYTSSINSWKNYEKYLIDDIKQLKH